MGEGHKERFGENRWNLDIDYGLCNLVSMSNVLILFIALWLFKRISTVLGDIR